MQIWAESGKSALPICNYSQILYQFLTFTQNLKRSRRMRHGVLSTGSLPVLFTMRLRVFVKEPARYRIRLEKPIPLTLHNKIPKNHVDTE